MQGLKDVVVPVLQGFRDSLRGIVVILTIDKEMQEAQKKSPTKSSPAKYSKDQRFGVLIAFLRILSFQYLESKVLKTTIQCMFLNVVVSVASVYLLEYIILPIIMFFINNIVMICSLSENAGHTIGEYILPAIKIIFSTFWILPIFAISRMVNCLWFQDIADSVYRCRIGRPILVSSLSKLIADFFFSIVVQLLFLCQAFLVSLIPLSPINEILEIGHLCLLYSLYAYDYKWCNMGWELHRRLEFIENNWPYFIGFGLPMALATKYIKSFVLSGCVFAFFFPLLIISGNAGDPVTVPSYMSMKLFTPVVAIANIVTSRFIGPKRR